MSPVAARSLLWVCGIVAGCSAPRPQEQAERPCTPAASVGPHAAASAEPQAPAATAAAQRASELLVSANRKMMHGDGAGCLSDMDEARRLDPNLERHMDVVRAQCEMAAGQCQAGKERVRLYYQREMAMGPEQSNKLAESIASMRCNGGDASARDRFLVASQELTVGAYIEKKPPQFCSERVTLLRELGQSVPALPYDDQQVSGTKQALFFTAAACFARAGDCASAKKVYFELFPREGFGPNVDEATRQSIMQQSFDSSIERCRK